MLLNVFFHYLSYCWSCFVERGIIILMCGTLCKLAHLIKHLNLLICNVLLIICTLNILICKAAIGLHEGAEHSL